MTINNNGNDKTYNNDPNRTMMMVMMMMMMTPYDSMANSFTIFSLRIFLRCLRNCTQQRNHLLRPSMSSNRRCGACHLFKMTSHRIVVRKLLLWNGGAEEMGQRRPAIRPIVDQQTLRGNHFLYTWMDLGCPKISEKCHEPIVMVDLFDFICSP